MKEINIKITNAGQLIKVLEQILYNAEFKEDGYSMSFNDGFYYFKASLQTLIKVLKEAE